MAKSTHKGAYTTLRQTKNLRLAHTLRYCTVLAAVNYDGVLAADRLADETYMLRIWYEDYRNQILSSKAAKKRTASTVRAERERQAEGWHSDAEFALLVWLFQYRCAYCWHEAELTEDHVIPLAHMGTHYIENILPACRSCNSKKGARA